jgi:hypothetical protein
MRERTSTEGREREESGKISSDGFDKTLSRGETNENSAIKLFPFPFFKRVLQTYFNILFLLFVLKLDIYSVNNIIAIRN